MNDTHRQTSVGHSIDASPSPLAGADAPTPDEPQGSAGDAFDESLFEELSTLIDDGRNYAAAELAYQRTRAKLAGRLTGVSLLLVALALILLHIAFLALAVGLVIALEPLVSIWGAILIVVGGLLVLVGLLGWMAFSRTKTLGALFSEADEGHGA